MDAKETLQFSLKHLQGEETESGKLRVLVVDKKKGILIRLENIGQDTTFGSLKREIEKNFQMNPDEPYGLVDVQARVFKSGPDDNERIHISDLFGNGHTLNVVSQEVISKGLGLLGARRTRDEQMEPA